jgi:hypothetical protein
MCPLVIISIQVVLSENINSEQSFSGGRLKVTRAVSVPVIKYQLQVQKFY